VATDIGLLDIARALAIVGFDVHARAWLEQSQDPGGSSIILLPPGRSRGDGSPGGPS